MIIIVGSTSKSIDVSFFDDSGIAVTGLTYLSAPTIKCSLAGANADVTLTLASLASVISPWVSGGFIERGEGSYRLDLPDSVLSSSGNLTFRSETTNKHLLAPIINIEGAGTGARSVTVTVNDGSTALENATVRFTKNSESYIGLTSASGVKVFSLNDGTWTVSISLPGYTFTPTTLVVDGTETQTYSMAAVSIPSSSVNMTTGYLYTYSKAGIIETGINVKIKAIDIPDEYGVVVDGTERTVVSNGSGLVSFTNLFKGATYKLRRSNSITPAISITIPTTAGATYELPSLIGIDL